MSKKSKSIYYKNLDQKLLVFEPEFTPFITKNNRIAATHFETSIKYLFAQLEKRFKETRKNLGIIDRSFLNKNIIWPKNKVWDK